MSARHSHHILHPQLAFRELVRDYGVDVAYTPMTLADVFHRSEYARDSDFTTNAADTPVVLQFAARVPVDMERASQLVAAHVAAVDLNCGCPQRWAYQEGIGARLMEEPETVRDVVRQVKAHVDVPCSVKIRVHKDLRETMEYARQMEMAGADWITVHGRTRHQRSSEPVNVDAIRMVKEQAGIPVVANGDIFTLDDADRMYAATNVDGIMSARGLLQNPALFAGHEHTPWECVQKYVQHALNYGTTTFIFHHHLMFMLESVMSAAERRSFNTLASIPAILDFLQEHYGLAFCQDNENQTDDAQDATADHHQRTPVDASSA
ncbi:hypothetical protein THASP1DRAFT_13016 [Thamnocephalis sphaerospora]|uniref:tRNA-dihydrouridine synthase n=1 Tax=Thamnocephalis sphaerospora TaxID=78915 RepID=A0A4P9XVI7_9FUNG|nr:hypothetical protein THASP1DRAFT_13016 [Thamnocephalis sphaerospora]|eukprot:RKP10304.1 hypothetical protein THASP1DRAFT_13016 [Thamnocephalis sphaerospora]